MQRIFLISFLAFSFLFATTSCKNKTKYNKSIVDTTVYSNTSKVNNKLLLVKYHADWCGSCKEIEPKITKLNSRLKGKPIKYIALDLTNKASTKNAKTLASNYGISDLIAEKQKTGYVAIIDANSKKILGKLYKTQSVEEMQQQINKLL